jgi:hypothetical protein
MHHPRVAWDAAQTLATMATADLDLYAWYRDRTGAVLGTACRLELDATRRRLLAIDQRDDERFREIGRWRARIQEAIGTDCHLAEDVYLLTLHARSVFAGLGPKSW